MYDIISHVLVTKLSDRPVFVGLQCTRHNLVTREQHALLPRFGRHQGVMGSLTESASKMGCEQILVKAIE